MIVCHKPPLLELSTYCVHPKRGAKLLHISIWLRLNVLCESPTNLSSAPDEFTEQGAPLTQCLIFATGISMLLCLASILICIDVILMRHVHDAKSR